LKVNDENSKIRIQYSEAWIPGSGSPPKCPGSGTLPHQKKVIVENGNGKIQISSWATAIDVQAAGKASRCPGERQVLQTYILFFLFFFIEDLFVPPGSLSRFMFLYFKFSGINIKIIGIHRD
jgi:hypothetical protein